RAVRRHDRPRRAKERGGRVSRNCQEPRTRVEGLAGERGAGESMKRPDLDQICLCRVEFKRPQPFPKCGDVDIDRPPRSPAPLRWAQIGAPLPMADERVRRQIAHLAAQMMYQRTETEYFTAKRKAARQLGLEYRYRPGDLPSNKEIRDEIQMLAR